MRTRCLTNAVLIVISLGATLAAEPATQPTPSDLIDGLLKRSAPPRAWEGPDNRNAIPADDEPLDNLVTYWMSEDVQSDQSDPASPVPSRRVAERLLGACLDHPEYLPALLRYVSEQPPAVDLVKTIYDKQTDGKNWEDDQREAIQRWVRQRSRYFRAELIAAAKAVEYVDAFELKNEGDLLALAKLDWSTALPILQRLAEAKDMHVSAIALQILTQHAIEKGDQAAITASLPRLQKIADNRTAPAFARDRAFTALQSVDWPGRDAWYLSLYAEAELDRLSEGGNGFTSPLRELISRQPEHYVPLVLGLLKNPDPIVRGNAVQQLAGTHRADAVRPMLPALISPDGWPNNAPHAVLSALAHVNLPESVPLMLQAWPKLESYDQELAAYALAQQHAKEAPEMLKEALGRTTDLPGQQRLAEALMATGTMTDAELALDIEAWLADNSDTPAAGNDANSAPAANIGSGVIRYVDQNDKVAAILLARANLLDASKPELAERIRRQLQNWPVKSVDIYLISQLQQRPLDENLISQALERLPGIRAASPVTLRTIAGNGGDKAGFAAALLNDPTVIQSILHGDDDRERLMLFCAGRLAGASVPLSDIVVCLDDKNTRIAQAAESFLMQQDTPKAREILLARHPHDIIIFGGQSGLSGTNSEFQQLRIEMQRADGPDEMYAFLSGGGFGDDGQRILRIRGEQAVMSFETANGRTVERMLTPAEFAALHKIVIDEQFDDLPNLPNLRVMDGVWYDYVHLTRTVGCHIYINNPGSAGTANTPYYRLTRLLQKFTATGTFSSHYRAQDQVPGLKVLWTHDKNWIKRVWKKGADFRVLIGTKNGDEGWHAWESAHIADPVDPPPGVFKTRIDESVVPKNFGIEFNHCSAAFLCGVGDDLILTGDRWFELREGKSRAALWRCHAGKEPVRITKGEREFFRPVTTADGKWAVVKERLISPKESVLDRVNLADGTVEPIALPENRDGEAEARLLDGRILISGTKIIDSTQDRAYWKLEPATGKLESANGDYWPLADSGVQPLQAAAKAGTAWAIEGNATATTIGSYDLNAFKFTPTVSLPEIHFDSSAFWVDESENMAYLCVEGDLLSVPVLNTK